MKTFILTVFSCFCLFQGQGFIVGQDINKNSPKRNELVILTYNVHRCEGLDGEIDYQRISDIINRIDPQIAALQELDSVTLRSGGHIDLEELASRTNMYAIYGPFFTFEGGKYGVGILSKKKPIKWESVPIPGRIENRILIAEFKKYILCCTHLSGKEEAKLKAIAILNDHFKKVTKPVFFAGDLNSRPGSNVINSIETKWTMLNDPTVTTGSSDRLQNCIDHIFVLNDKSHSYSVVQRAVEKEPIASDHFPSWVKVAIKKK